MELVLANHTATLDAGITWTELTTQEKVYLHVCIYYNWYSLSGPTCLLGPKTEIELCNQASLINYYNGICKG